MTTEVSVKRPKRMTAGKHSNIHHLPTSTVAQQEVECRSNQVMADLSRAHVCLVQMLERQSNA